MAHHDPSLDAETLRAQLDLRWPDATGTRRATTDETHRLALVHPQYDGFITLEVQARTDLDGVFVLPDPVLDRVVTSHHRTGPIAREQVLPIDLELHPGNVHEHGTTGLLRLVDASGEDVCEPVRLTLGADPTLSCVLAGAVDGPFAATEEFAAAVDDLLAGRVSARKLARRIDHGDEVAPEAPASPKRWWRR